MCFGKNRIVFVAAIRGYAILQDAAWRITHGTKKEYIFLID